MAVAVVVTAFVRVAFVLVVGTTVKVGVVTAFVWVSAVVLYEQQIRCCW